MSNTVVEKQLTSDRQYLQDTNMHATLEAFVLASLKARPTNLYDYMIEWAEAKLQGKSSPKRDRVNKKPVNGDGVDEKQQNSNAPASGDAVVQNDSAPQAQANNSQQKERENSEPTGTSANGQEKDTSANAAIKQQESEKETDTAQSQKQTVEPTVADSTSEQTAEESGDVAEERKRQQAALKIQCAQRQKAARQVVSEKKERNSVAPTASAEGAFLLTEDGAALRIQCLQRQRKAVAEAESKRTAQRTVA